MSVERTGNDFILIIQDVTVNDGGRYNCKGSEKSESFTLEVDCKWKIKAITKDGRSAKTLNKYELQSNEIGSK